VTTPQRSAVWPTGRAVVLVSGGDASTPFTSPHTACRSGFAAGITNSALREHLLGRSLPVFTAPAHNRRGPVIAPGPDTDDCFADCPEVLAGHLTITSTADIDLAGERLNRFIDFLHRHHAVDEVDFVGHSNGGLFARAAIRILREVGSAVRVRSLTTLGTPWHGAFGLRYLAGEIDISACAGDAWCEQMMAAAVAEAAARDLGLCAQNTSRYLDGPHGWNPAQSGVLDEVPVLLIGGDRFTNTAGDPQLWPFDGYVSLHSALASDVDDTVLPNRRQMIRPDTHSIVVSRQLGLADETGLTADPEVLAAVAEFITAAV